jgi:hypothetical protein
MRRVFYIPGYDLLHPRRYRELYRTEGAAQAAISDYQLTLSPKQGGGNYGWQVDSVIDGGGVHVDAEALVWSDIERDSMVNSIAATYWQLKRTAWIYITTGALWQLMKLRKGPGIAALYPVGMPLVQLLLACLAFYLVALLIGEGVRLLETAIYGPMTIWPRWLTQTIIASLIGGSIAFRTVLRDFRVELVDEEPPVPVAHLTVRSRDGIRLRIVCRYHWKCLSLTLEMSVANMYQ